MKKLFTIAGFFVFILIFLTGCGPSYVTVGVRPQTPVYVRTSAPGPGYIWVEGEWTSGSHGYVYKTGYWTQPRRKYHQYIPGNWKKGKRGWYWVSGQWR